jgi:hypothetical protein
VALVDAFAYSGEMITWDEDGKRQDHFVIVLAAEKIDQAALAKSTEPVSDLNYWLYTEEPATLTIKLDPALKYEIFQANLKGELHSKTMTCYCDGAEVELKLEDGRLRGRVLAPALKPRFDPADDPNAARSLAFEVKVDVPVVKIGG